MESLLSHFRWHHSAPSHTLRFVCSASALAQEAEAMEFQVPNSAPARISNKSITFVMPAEEDNPFIIPQSGPVVRGKAGVPHFIGTAEHP